MIHFIKNKIIWLDTNANIIFNPVSTNKGHLGEVRFNNLLRKIYPNVYDKYKDFMIGTSQKRLLSDIELVKVDKTKLIINGYVYNKKNELNSYALAKALVELYNIADEYKLNIAIPVTMLYETKENEKTIMTIIDTIFDDFKYDCYIYI